MRDVWLSGHERQPWRRCPACGALHDAMTGVNDRPGVTIGQGAVMICRDCGSFGVLDDTVEGGWRLPTGDEQHAIMAEPTVSLAIAAVRRRVTERD